jgi:esterase/lipase
MLLGFSMGGAFGGYLAVKFPVHRLVLLAPAYKNFNLEAPNSKGGSVLAFY